MADDDKHTQALRIIEALHASEAITDEQKDQLRIAMHQAADRPSDELFAESGLFSQEELNGLAKAGALLNQKALKVNQLALYLTVGQKAGTSLKDSLDRLESFARPPDTTNLPPIIEILVKARVIGDEHKRALQVRIQSSPAVPPEEHILALGLLSKQGLETAKLGEKLINEGQITQAHFSVAMFDFLTQGISMEDSLKSRGWWPRTNQQTSG